MCSNNINDNKLSCFSTLSLPSLGEMEQTVCMLERGTIITKYYPRRRPEQKTLMLRRETRQVNKKYRPALTLLYKLFWFLFSWSGLPFHPIQGQRRALKAPLICVKSKRWVKNYIRKTWFNEYLIWGPSRKNIKGFRKMEWWKQVCGLHKVFRYILWEWIQATIAFSCWYETAWHSIYF